MNKNYMSESVLNLLLRRADWRFLLPNPNPGKSICFTEEQLQKSVEYISESAVRYNPNVEEHDCDLAVGTNPEEDTLHRAWSSLRPGGSFYAEWDVKPYQNVKHIITRLEKSGFEQIDFYLPKPSPDKSPSWIWIPIDSKGAIEYFLQQSSKHNRKNVLKMLAKTIRSALWLLSPGLFIKYPALLNSNPTTFRVCSTAYKPQAAVRPGDRQTKETRLNPEGITSYKDSLMKIIRHRPERLPDHKEPKDIRTLLLTPGWHSNNRIVSIIFTEPDLEPTLVIKQARVYYTDSTLKKEAESLRVIQKKFGDTQFIPKLIFAEQNTGIYRVGQSYISGIPIDTALMRNNYRELALKTTDFLVDFALKTKFSALENWRNKAVIPIVTDFVSSFGSFLDPELVQKTVELSDTLELSDLVWVHGDLAPRNVLVNDEGRIAVIDWEDIVTQGLPIIDLVYFLTYLSVHVEDTYEPDEFLKCYRRMLDVNTFTGGIFKECIDLYCKRVNIASSAVPFLRLLTWVDVLNRRCDELALFEGRSPSPETLGKIFHIRLWEEELSRAGKL